MKKKLATLLLLAVVMATTTFATTIDVTVSKSVLISFNQKFAQATAVSWTKADDYMKASFTMNGQHLFAYYTVSGDLLGVSRNITTAQLPINLQADLMNKLSNSWVTELFEFSTDNETTYYITLESADTRVSLKGSGTFSWIVYNKNRKI